MSVKVLRINNGPFFDFPIKLKSKLAKHGDYIVEYTSDGGCIRVRRPGRKRSGDFIVTRIMPDNSEETTTYKQLLEEFSGAISTDASAGRAFVRAALEVIAGEEPPKEYVISGTERTGDCILKLIKWIVAQEDINYPISSGREGRRMFAHRLWELHQGVRLQEVIRRAEQRGSKVNPISDVNYDECPVSFTSRRR